MKRLKTLKSLWLLILIGIIILSCDKEETFTDAPPLSLQTFEVSTDLAKSVALNFTKDEVFVGKPKEEKYKFSLRSSKDNNSIPFPGFEKKVIKEVLKLKGHSGVTALFVINFIQDGYIIVPSTKKEVPILAFSNKGTFNQYYLTHGIEGWIKQRIEIIEYLKSNVDIGVSDEIEEQWDGVAPPIDDEEIIYGGSVDERVGPLLQTRWSQGNGYNELVRFNNCPEGKALTGCVATAMAQVMRYWEYPNNYNWSVMPNQIDLLDPLTSSTLEIAKLMNDIGDAVGATYTCSLTNAYTSVAKDVLVNTFGYANYASYITFNMNTIVQELGVFNRPVILRGEEPTGGHAWVCDGYQRIKYISIHNPNTPYEYETYTFSDYYLHMNWGWNDTFNTNSNWFYNGIPQVSIHDFSTGYNMISSLQP